MAYCSTCGAAIPDGATFCPKCGARSNDNQTVCILKDKDQMLALILSFLITGLGQVYVGKVLRGIAFFLLGDVLFIAVFIGGAFLAGASITLGSGVMIISLLLPLVVWVYGMYDAYTLAGKYNDELQRTHRKPW